MSVLYDVVGLTYDVVGWQESRWTELEGGSAAAPVCSPVNLKQIAKAGLLAVEWGQQAWAGWGGQA